MKNTVRAILFFVIVLAAFSGPASAAQTLSADQVKQFVEAMPEIMAFSDGMKREGKDAILQTAILPGPGSQDFAPYRHGLVALKEKFPADYGKLGKIVGRHGFPSQENWAETADGVMLSYMAVKMIEDAPNGMAAMEQEMNAEMMASLPPEAKAQMEQLKAMMQAVRSVPAENRDAVRPFVPEIDQWGRPTASP